MGKHPIEELVYPIQLNFLTKELPKFKLLKSQSRGSIAYVKKNDELIIKKIKKNNYKSKIYKVDTSNLKNFLNQINNKYFTSEGNKENLSFPNSHLDIKVIHGDCSSVSILKDAEVSSADLFIDVTEMQSVNLTSCFLAKQLGAKKTIARISNT